MDQQTRQFFAIAFSLLLVISAITPAGAALEPPNQTSDQTVLHDLSDFFIDYNLAPDIRPRFGTLTATTTD